MAESKWADQLRKVPAEKLATHLWTRSAFDQAFPAFFRVIGADVRSRLALAGLATQEHVGIDLRSAWLARLPGLSESASLNWVAFDFPGISVWDLHIGVTADLTVWPATCTVGFHALERCWPAVEALLARQPWQSNGWLPEQPTHIATIQEFQLNDPTSRLDLNNLLGEAQRLANRAVQLYRLVLPLAVELAKG